MTFSGRFGTLSRVIFIHIFFWLKKKTKIYLKTFEQRIHTHAHTVSIVSGHYHLLSKNKTFPTKTLQRSNLQTSNCTKLCTNANKKSSSGIHYYQNCLVSLSPAQLETNKKNRHEMFALVTSWHSTYASRRKTHKNHHQNCTLAPRQNSCQPTFHKEHFSQP